MTTDRKPLVSQPNEGEDVGGVLCKVRAEQTDGAYSVLQLNLYPGQGAPRHVHYREDEILLVAAGACEVQYNGETHIVGTGGVIVLPKGIPHAFRNPGESLTQLIITAVPGGLEKFFEDMSRVASDDPDAPAKRAAIAQQYQIDFSPGAD